MKFECRAYLKYDQFKVEIGMYAGCWILSIGVRSGLRKICECVCRVKDIRAIRKFHFFWCVVEESVDQRGVRPYPNLIRSHWTTWHYVHEKNIPESSRKGQTRLSQGSAIQVSFCEVKVRCDVRVVTVVCGPHTS